MADLINLTINGRPTAVPYDTPLLTACRDAGVDVPTLCHNDNVAAYGVCRICSVEVNEGRKTRVVPSCVYTVRREIAVQTDSPRIHRHRAMLLNLLLARCPDEEPIQKLAAQYGVLAPHPRFQKKNDDCILCGLCVQICRDIVGVAALGFEGRGFERRAVSPFDAENPVCIACGACAFACPTQCIEFGEAGGKRWLKRWHREVDMLVCEKCGNYWLPDALSHQFAKRMGIDPASLNVCTNCR
jgi:predicted molibdopterin-dependent oxidoreductase YjgC